jgi:hypothetical protein
MLGFDFRVEYKLSSTNVVVNTLSRRDTEATVELVALLAPLFRLFDTIRQEIAATLELHAIKEEVIAGTRGDKWRMVDDLITMAGHVYISSTSSCKTKILASAHETGHEGVQKTLLHLRSDVHLLDAWSTVQVYVHACDTCQRNKTDHLHPASLLQPLVVPTLVWVDIAWTSSRGFHTSTTSL